MNKEIIEKLKELIEKIDPDKKVFDETRDLVEEYETENNNKVKEKTK